jgi:hypothetical protein
MISRLLLCFFIASAMSTCDSKKKKDEEPGTKPSIKDQSRDVSYQGFVGRLRIAVSKKDLPMLASMMTSDFGYRWDDAPPGENVFTYWDRHNLWGELAAVLNEPARPHQAYMVAPARALGDPNYNGYLAGFTMVQGSWKFAYFVPAQEPAAPQPAVSGGVPDDLNFVP